MRASILLTLLVLTAITPMDAKNTGRTDAWIHQTIGSPEISRDGATWNRVQIKDPVLPGDTIRTDGSSRVTIAFAGASLARIEENSQVKLKEAIFSGKKNSLKARLDIQNTGRVLAVIRKLSKKGNEVSIGTPVCVVGVRGTGFSVDVPDGETSRFTVFDGKIIVRDFVSEQGLSSDDNTMLMDFLNEMMLEAGQGAVYRKGKGFSREDSADDTETTRKNIEALTKESDELAKGSGTRN